MFDDMPGYIWMDGQTVPWKEAKIHVMSHGLHYASSVFEGMRTYRGKIFKLEEHCKRFIESLRMLDLSIPYSVADLMEAAEQVMRLGDYRHAYVRMIAWCGSKIMTVSNRNADVRVAIGIWERPVAYPESHFTDGIKMSIASWRRPDPRTAPVSSKAAGLYMISSMSKVEAERAGYDDALMLDWEGCIAEATSSNIFLVMDGALHTPTPDCFLNGITRQAVLKLSVDLGLKTYERKIKLEELGLCQEVFLTGTAIEILPVGLIENRDFSWRFIPGAVTQKIRKAFNAITDAL